MNRAGLIRFSSSTVYHPHMVKGNLGETFQGVNTRRDSAAINSEAVLQSLF